MANKQLKVSLIILASLIIINLLFPPYQIENGRKFFDFLFNDEYRYFYTGQNKTYTITDRNLTKRDSAYALEIRTEIISDTLFSYKQIKEFPEFNPKHNNINGALYKLEKLSYWDLIDNIISNKSPEYYSKIIDTILYYPRHTITKPRSVKTYRHLIAYQLIFQIIISALVVSIFYLLIKRR